MKIISQTDELCNIFNGIDWCKIEIAGNIAIKTTTTNTGKKPICRKISKEQYVFVPTGEIRDYNIKERESEDDILRTKQSISKTMRDLKLRVCANFSGAPDELFVTLTYAENMTDTNRLKTDFSAFFKRLKYAFRDKYEFGYISVCEPQARGAWHIHMFLKCTDITGINRDRAYIQNEYMQKIWGHGYTKTESIKFDGIVNYFNTSYFAPQSSDDGGHGKSADKYERLRYFPKTFRWYRCSENMKKPSKELATYERAEDFLRSLGFICEDVNRFTVIDDNNDDKTVCRVEQKKYSKEEKGIARRNPNNT